MKIKAVALLISGLVALSGCGGSSSKGDIPDNVIPPLTDLPDPTVNPELINFNDIPVHDPSVIRDVDGTFYVVGSHLAMAKSTDLVHWEQVSPGIALVNPDFAANGLFANYETEVAEGIEWTGGYAGSWASDIRILADGRYYFYYNHCTVPETGECNGPRSYLGVAVGDAVTGPFENVGLFLRSGQTTQEIADGYGVGEMTAYNGNNHPNTIDPHTFYDKDGKLWMIYGSYAGGIFILEMDDATGLPLPDQGYGKHLAGGNHSSIEGTFVLYSPESDYYYMFASFGGYEAEDGYNLRIARSREPDGPYLDAEGKDMAAARGNWDSIAPYGVKLMGGFNFASHIGDTVASRGYLSPGHNSAYYDAESGIHYLITHTRFPDRGTQHAIRVHEMFINADGWLVASPHRYVPIDGANIVDAQDLLGDYKFINHEKDINRQAKQSVAISLTETRRVTGDVTGYYRLYDDQPNRITLYLDGLDTFEGVLRWQWDEMAEALVPVFSAVSAKGVSVWGSRQSHMTNADVLQTVADALDLPDVFKGDAIDLPTTGTRGVDIVWSSSNPNVIKPDGVVIRPNVGEGDQTVSVTATLNRNGQTLTKTFDIRVLERQTFNRVAHFQFEDDLSESLDNFEAGQVVGDRFWKTGEGAVSYAAGQNGQAVVLDGTSGILLPEGLITNYEYTVSFWINPTVITPFSTAFYAAVDEEEGEGEPGAYFSNRWLSVLPQSWDENTMLWSNNSDSWFDGSAGERIPAGAWTHLAVSVNRGLVRVYINGEEKFSGGNLADFFTRSEGKFALGVNYWDIPLSGLIDDLKIYEAALAAGEVIALDVEAWPVSQLLDSAQGLLDLGSIDTLQDNLYLPVTGPYASAISWVSSNPSVIRIEADTGVVTRPGSTESNAEVTLTATITLDGETTTKAFLATVLSLAPPEPIAVFSFDEDLMDSEGTFGAGSVTGNRIDNTGGTLAFAEGIMGSALDLNGYGVKLPDNLITSNVYSISMWLYPRVLAQFTPVFFGASTTESWISVVPFGPGSGNTMLWSGTNWYDADAGMRIPANTWTHFVAVNNAGTLTIYLNGEESFRGNNFPNVFGTPGTKQFGLGVNFWDTPFNGLVDQLKFYAEPLGITDVEDLFDEVFATP